jgi:hypothetical protein
MGRFSSRLAEYPSRLVSHWPCHNPKSADAWQINWRPFGRGCLQCFFAGLAQRSAAKGETRKGSYYCLDLARAQELIVEVGSTGKGSSP